MSVDCETTNTDSNATGLRIAEEACPKVLPSSPIWRACEPNSYSGFGGQTTTVARNPINNSRQRKKGIVTDLDASGGYIQDLTQTNLTWQLQGFFFADAREKGTTVSLYRTKKNIVSVVASSKHYNVEQTEAVSATIATGGAGNHVGDTLTLVGGTTIAEPTLFQVAAVDGGGAVTSVIVADPGHYSATPANAAAVTGGSGGTQPTLNVVYHDTVTFVVGNMVLASGFDQLANNGVKTVSAYSGGVLTVVETVSDETVVEPLASLQTVGHRFASGVVSITMNGNLVRLSSTSFDLNTLGLIAGEWVYVGGDSAASAFVNNDPGFARIGKIYPLAAGLSYLEFDKIGWVPIADAGTGKTIELYFGTLIKNEKDPTLIKRRTYQLERTLGQDANGTRAEYLLGAVPSELTLNIPAADKVTVDLKYMAIDHEVRNSTLGLKPGTRPDIVEAEAFNTSQHFPRIKLATVDLLHSNVAPLFAFATTLTITLNNNVTVNKAIGTLGGFSTSAGSFDIGGSETVYFADVDSVEAVRENKDITLDLAMVQGNAGMVWDIGLLALGDGRLTVEQDKPIMLNLETNAAENIYGNTLQVVSFAYLPDVAAL